MIVILYGENPKEVFLSYIVSKIFVNGDNIERYVDLARREYLFEDEVIELRSLEVKLSLAGYSRCYKEAIIDGENILTYRNAQFIFGTLQEFAEIVWRR